MSSEYLEPTLKNIGENLYKLRHAKNDKMIIVAKAAGVKHSVISKIENGKYDCLTIRLLLRLATYYETSIDDIIK